MGALLTPPAVPTAAANTPRGTTWLQTASLTLALCTPLPQCHFKRLGAPSHSCPQIPLQTTGRGPSPRCWSLHCHAGNPNSQENPPNPLGAITPQALHRHNTHLAIYMIHGVKCLSDNSLGPAALAISSVKCLQNPKVLREKSSYFD